MGRAIDLFVTYRFIKLLVTPFNKMKHINLALLMTRVTVFLGTNKPTTLRTIAERMRTGSS